MLELAVDDVAPNTKLGVCVRAETCSALYAIFVDHAERSKGLVFRVVVVRKAEGVEGIQPAVIRLASFVPWSFGDLENRGAAILVGRGGWGGGRARGHRCGAHGSFRGRGTR